MHDGSVTATRMCIQEQDEWDDESLQAVLFVALLHACDAGTLLQQAEPVQRILEATIVPANRYWPHEALSQHVYMRRSTSNEI